MPIKYALSAWNEAALYLLRASDERLEFMLISPADSPLIGEWILFADYAPILGVKVAEHRRSIGALLMAVDAVNVLPDALARTWIARAETLRRAQYKDLLEN